MSTDRIHGEVVFTCDDCDDTLETGQADFNDALAEKKRAGWVSRGEPRGGWSDVCPDCGSGRSAFKPL